MAKLYSIILVFYSLSAFGQTYFTATPEGFGMATTGGGDGPQVTVTTYNELKTQLILETPKVILVSGVINISAGQHISEVITDKTIIGLPGARLVNNTQTQSGSGILNLQNGSNNIIIRNLIFEGPGAYDTDGRDNLTADGCTNLWVDHCEFQDGVDGNFDIKGNSDNVTVSWCKFTYLKPPVAGGPGGSNDHRYSNLVGSSDSQSPPDGHYSVTFQNCYWADGCKERMPRARNAELHILNCYYNTNVSSSRALGFSGGINSLSSYVENSDFANIGTVYQSYGGTVSLEFENCINGVSNLGSVDAPTYDYSVLPVAEVASIIGDTECGAGATLQVSSTGAVSSSCDNLNSNSFELSAIDIYPTLIENSMSFKFPSGNVSDLSISIYSISGQKIFSNVIEYEANEEVSINLEHFSQGVYFVKLLFENTYRTIRVIKK
ncbi:T9SS type A sorting domain-containing protein [Sediminibacter sp. Hel_I_10]|uniref:pectate lyase family protein n=1 Tax=Sediminibacter sp. Hel_I_10 TaxID=1392490 RepID=UPI00055BBCDE|nr:T9SS type A sorting domain-containing protein [Sediminibacter sp. Hel_I_10]